MWQKSVGHCLQFIMTLCVVQLSLKGNLVKVSTGTGIIPARAVFVDAVSC